ncbi:hypothetical protein KAJ27_06740 [bacterium]|nr:hypothetical protein [bacterium]
MKKSRLIWIGFIFLIFLNGCTWDEISSGHGFGGIIGNFYLGGADEGLLPDIEVRVEAYTDYADGSASANPTRVDYKNLKTHGVYQIDGLPEGTYNLRFFIKDYHNGYSYSFVPENVSGGGTTGDDDDDSDDGEATAPRAEAIHNVWEAFVRKNEMYVMPDIYIHKREVSGYGTVRGKIFSIAGNMPIEGVMVSAVLTTDGAAPQITDTTDANGEYILSKLESGKTYNIVPSAVGFKNLGGADGGSVPSVVISKDMVVYKDIFITPIKARITGQINFSGRYASFFMTNLTNIVKIRCDSNNFTEGDSDFPSTPTMIQNTFTFDVPSGLSRYTITATGAEPHFSGSIKTLVPSLSASQNYILPEDSIIFEYLSKTIIIDANGVDATDPSIPGGANSIIYCQVTGSSSNITGVLDSFEMRPNGSNGYRAYVEMPYGVFEFEPIGLAAVDDGWTSNAVQYNIDDSVERVLMHILSN